MYLGGNALFFLLPYYDNLRYPIFLMIALVIDFAIGRQVSLEQTRMKLYIRGTV